MSLTFYEFKVNVLVALCIMLLALHRMLATLVMEEFFCCWTPLTFCLLVDLADNFFLVSDISKVFSEALSFSLTISLQFLLRKTIWSTVSVSSDVLSLLGVQKQKKSSQMG